MLWSPPEEAPSVCCTSVPTSDQDKCVLGSSVLRRKLCNRKNIWGKNKIILLFLPDCTLAIVSHDPHMNLSTRFFGNWKFVSM